MDELVLSTVQRLTSLEERLANTEKQVGTQAELIDKINDKMLKLLDEVRQIRNALYVMAIAVSASVPAVSQMLTALKIMLGF